MKVKVSYVFLFLNKKCYQKLGQKFTKFDKISDLVLTFFKFSQNVRLFFWNSLLMRKIFCNLNGNSGLFSQRACVFHIPKVNQFVVKRGLDCPCVIAKKRFTGVGSIKAYLPGAPKTHCLFTIMNHQRISTF